MLKSFRKYFSFQCVDHLCFLWSFRKRNFFMTYIYFTIVLACQTEDLDHIYDPHSPNGDPSSQLTPHLDQIFDPLDYGFDTSVACSIEEDPDMTYKKGLFLEGNILLESHQRSWSQPTEYISYFVSNVDGIVHQSLYNTSTSALFPIFWDRLSYGEHVVTFIVFDEEVDEPVCMSKHILWSDYEE